MAFSISYLVVIGGFWLLTFFSSMLQCDAVYDDYIFLQAEVGPGSLRERREVNLGNGSKLVFGLDFQRPLSEVTTLQSSLAPQFSSQIQLPESLDNISITVKPWASPSGSRNYEPAFREKFEPVLRKLDSGQDALLTKLSLALTIRDNLINVLGYILYQSTKTLDPYTYAGLMDILKGFCTKRIHIAEILPHLPAIAYKTPQEQYLTLFNTLKKVKPLYLTGAVDVWIKALTYKSVDLNSILRPNNGALVADLFAGIDLALMSQLSIRTHFTDVAKHKAPKPITATMGPFFGCIYGGLLEGSIKVTRQIVALLMLNTPIYNHIAEVEEAQRYLADVLLSKDSSNLDFAVHNLDETTRGNPYSLVKRVLTNIIQVKNVDLAVKECAEIILPHFIPLNVITLNPNYNSMVLIVKNLKIDFDELFKHITPSEYPDDIVKVKDMLLLSIAKKELNMGTILKGFVIHEYTTPAEMIIAVLDRIWSKGRNSIPQYVSDALLAMLIHVKMKFAVLSSEAKTYESLNDIKHIVNAFLTPQTPDKIKLLIRGIVESLSAEQIPWKTILGELRLSDNSRPKQYIKTLFIHIVHLKVVKSPDLIKRMKDFVSYVDTTEEPKDCPHVECVNSNPAQKVTAVPPPVVTPKPKPNPREARKSLTDVDIGQLLSSILITAPDLPNVLNLQNYIKSTIPTFFPQFDLRPYKTSGDLLKALFQKYLAHPNLQRDRNIFNLFKTFFNKIQLNGLGARPIPWREVVIVRSIDMNSIMKALKINNLEKDGKSVFLEIVYDFLINAFHQDFSSGFEFQVYNTRGTFLQGFFNHIINYPGINPKVRNAFKALELYIQIDGPGAAPVDYVQ